MSYGENETNQELRSVGVISTLVVLAVCGLLTSRAWKDSPIEDNEKAMRRAEGLAYQLMDIHRAAQKDSRAPASSSSEGLIGSDPWGQPYRYRVLNHAAKPEDKKAQEYKLVIWSQGPNKKADTDDSKLDSDRDKVAVQFDGDDVGIVIVGK